MTKIFKKLEKKIAKINIILHVCICCTKTYRSQNVVITSYFVLQKAFFIFKKITEIWLIKQKNKENHKKHEKLQIFEKKILKNALLTLN